MTMNDRELPTIVLAHAAWFDASSWNKVTSALQRRGYSVVSAQLPLTSLKDDVRVLREVLARQSGPLVLAGHSYGGAVVTAAGADNANLKALVYIAAIVPDEGETVGELLKREPAHPKAPAHVPDANGLLWLKPENVRDALAPDASAEETALIAATQKPISVQCLGEPMTKPAWKQKPSWFLIAQNDRMISPATQRFAAERMGSRVTSLAVDHVPLLSKPDAVVDVIQEAARAE